MMETVPTVSHKDEGHPTVLISVFEKYGLVEFTNQLVCKFGFQVIASGGTARTLREAGIGVKDVEEVTHTPEMLNGRVKTLHPAIYAGILARETTSDQQDMKSHGYHHIDMVVCNLYPFESLVTSCSVQNVTIEEAVEQVDIGGVTLLRAAAKAHARVTVICDPLDYLVVLKDLETRYQVSPALRERLSVKAFEHTAHYDATIAHFFRVRYSTSNHLSLRYGMNPYQTPAHVYLANGEQLPFQVRNGHPGFINLLDAMNAWALVKELSQATGLPAAASFKHVSPAGAAVGLPLTEIERCVYMVDDLPPTLITPLASAYARARGADRMSSFGDWVALSDVCDEATAQILVREVSDGIIAPGFAPEAFALLNTKKSGKFVILEMDPLYEPAPFEERQVYGICFRQPRNSVTFSMSTLFPKQMDGDQSTGPFSTRIVSRNKKLPESAQLDLLIASVTLKYTQSNSVCYAKQGQVIGLGAGQQSRIHCTRLAGEKVEQWWMRHHPEILHLHFKESCRRSEKSNAIDMLVNGTLEDASEQEKQGWEASFEQVPKVFTAQERKEWMKNLQGVALSSDAFFPFSDNIHQAQRSGVHYILAPRGSVQDQAILDVADSYHMVVVHTDVRLFHH